ncbi:MAG: AMP-binding protein [Clostridia bacterium]|nr:AMP-binding protein [Clostridia bacterium]
MTFYERIILEIERAPQALSTVYDFAFRFTDEAYFEWTELDQVCSITYGETQQRIEQATAALHARLTSLPKNSPVGLYLPNSVDWVVSFWAILRAGFRPLLLNTIAPVEMTEGCIRAAGARYVIADRAFAGAEQITPAELREANGEPYCDWADDIILCTSGTTGAPKLISFDGKAVCAQIRNSGYILKNNRSVATFVHGKIKLLAFLPFYHIFGLSAVLLWFSCFGRTLVLLPSLSPEAIGRTCRTHEVTHIFALPVFWNAVADQVLRAAKRTGQSEKLERGLKLSLALQNLPIPRLGRFLARKLMRSVQKQALGDAVRFCISGGGALRADTMRVINGIGYPLYNGYGMTEIGIASVELRQSAKARLLGTVGKPFPTMETRIENETLRVRGQTCFSAEYRDGKRIPHDPMEWFDTQDCMTAEPDGSLSFAGRTDDMINGANGERIAPALIESAFGSPLIAALAAVELPAQSGPQLTLVVEPNQNNVYALATLSRRLYEKNETLPSAYRVQKFLIAREPLPLALTRKVQNGEVRRRIREGTLDVVEADRPAAPVETLYDAGVAEILPRVIESFSAVTGVPASAILPDSHFQYDLGGDSLTYLSLLEQLSESFHVVIDTDVAPDLHTPRAFAAYILKESE